MKTAFFLVLAASLPLFAFSTTLGEIGAAAAIAGKLQQTGQANVVPLVQQVKGKVEQYEEAEQRKIANIESMETTSTHSPQRISSSPEIARERALESLTESEVEKRFQDQGVDPETKPVNYKAGIQIFYKKNCAPSQKNCSKGAVLTNIKSVIFDYAHSRGSFAELKKK